jgi:hypothetical protein
VTTYVIWELTPDKGMWLLNAPYYPQTDPCHLASKPYPTSNAMLKTVYQYYADWNNGDIDEMWSLLSANFQAIDSHDQWKEQHSMDKFIKVSSACTLGDRSVGITVISSPK